MQADGKACFDGRWWVWDNTSPNPMGPSNSTKPLATLTLATQIVASDEVCLAGLTVLLKDIAAGPIDEPTRARLEQRLHGVIADDGYLFTSMTEGLVTGGRWFDKLQSGVYRKRGRS